MTHGKEMWWGECNIDRSIIVKYRVSVAPSISISLYSLSST